MEIKVKRLSDRLEEKSSQAEIERATPRQA